MPCYFHFSGQNIIKCITFCSKTQKIVINQYFLKYLRQSDCYLFRFSTSQIWTYYSNIIQILSGVSKDGENPLLKLLIRDSYLSALVSLGTVQHCRLFLSLLGGRKLPSHMLPNKAFLCERVTASGTRDPEDGYP